MTDDFDRSPTTFEVGEPNETTLISAGESDVFVAKYAETLHHVDPALFPVFDDSIEVSGVTASFPVPLGAIVTARFTNTSSTGIADPFPSVEGLTGGALLINGDGPPQAVGATITPDVKDGVLAPGESVIVTFVIRLEQRERFELFVSVRGRHDPTANIVQ